MRLGVCPQPLYALPFADALARVAGMGYQDVELPVDAGSPWIALEAADTARRVAERVRAAGLGISALSNHQEGQLLLGVHDAARERLGVASNGAPAAAARRLVATARLARALDVRVVCAFTGSEHPEWWFPWPVPDGYERMLPGFRERLLPVLDAFGENGVTLALECHPNQFAYDLDTARLALDAVGEHPALGFNLDPANLMPAGVDPLAFVAELGSRIVHVHAKDGERVASAAGRSGTMAHGDWARPGRGFRFRIPGHGQVPWPVLLAGLRSAGFTGTIAAEHEDPTFDAVDGLERAAAYLRPLVLPEPPR